MEIQYHNQDNNFTLLNTKAISEWLFLVIKSEGLIPGELNYVFCSDEALLEYNIRFLNHDTLTDVITFDYSFGQSAEKQVSGDILISIDRVEENAKKYSKNFDDELRRVMVHGLLHLCGYADKHKAAKLQMTQKEDFYLALLPR